MDRQTSHLRTDAQADFGRMRVRDAMQHAVAAIRKQLIRECCDPDDPRYRDYYAAAGEELEHFARIVADGTPLPPMEPPEDTPQ